jgi:hypothetical protein
MARFVQLIASLALLLLSLAAQASFPATQTSRWDLNGNGLPWYASPQAAMSADLAGAVASNSSCGYYLTNVVQVSPTSWTYTLGVTGGGCSPTNRSTAAVPTLTCPANSTLSGSQCTCSGSYIENASHTACVTVQQGVCEVLQGGGAWVSQTGVKLSPGQSVCTETGCLATMSSTLLYVTDKTTGVSSTEGAATYTGADCTYTPATGAQNDTCKGGTVGEINGVVTCVPYDPNLNVIQSIKTTATNATVTASTPTGATTTTTTKGDSQDTTCDGQNCTTKRTETTINGDGTSTDSTTTKTQTKADYCKENPQEAACAEDSKGAFEGNCTTGFKCKGDVALCAAARAVNEQKCLMTPGDSIQAQADKITGGTWASNLTEDVIDLGSLDQSNPFGSSCPSDQTFTVLGTTLTVPLADACPVLQMLGNLAVAMTLLTATIFVLRGFGST